MKIAILGTRGVPNYHGGFEQFAEHFSIYLANSGHEVYVYNSHTHPYQKKTFKGAHIIHCHDAEERIGTAGQFIYDLNCILDSRKRGFDIVLQLGYTSSSVWHWLMPKSSLIITNMDGLEWKRSKYSKATRYFLKKAEKWAAKNSDFLISDSVGIQTYLMETYSLDSQFIAYGANIFEAPNQKAIAQYSVANPGLYNMLIARLEPENNIESILDGVVLSRSDLPFLVVGKHETKYGRYLKHRYAAESRIVFLGGIYDQEHLNNLRYFSNLYFHGHSVGGTNPSLLEAMASNAFIIAHDNIFNKSVLEENAYYFRSGNDVSEILDTLVKDDHGHFIHANTQKIRELYSWEYINKKYLDFFIECFI